MGQAVSEKKAAPQQAPSCPDDMLFIMDIYKDVKFARRESGNGITLYPRAALSWAELDSYLRVTKSEISPSDARVIMNIDAIFEAREDV